MEESKCSVHIQHYNTQNNQFLSNKGLVFCILEVKKHLKGRIQFWDVHCSCILLSSQRTLNIPHSKFNVPQSCLQDVCHQTIIYSEQNIGYSQLSMTIMHELIPNRYDRSNFHTLNIPCKSKYHPKKMNHPCLANFGV